MDIHIVIKDDTLRGIVTSVLLAVISIFLFIIVQSTREGITFWLYTHFPKNKAKLYIMATSRRGSYLDVLGVLNILGGFPMFIVLLVMTLGMLGNTFSGLVVSTKNVPMDLCTNNGCFSTGFGKNLLTGYDNVTTIVSEYQITPTTSMRDFAFQDMNNTITEELPWAGASIRSTNAVIVPPEIQQVPLDRLKRRVEYTGVLDVVSFETVSMGVEYIDGTFLSVTQGVSLVSQSGVVLNRTGWGIHDSPPPNIPTNRTMELKLVDWTTSTATGINLILVTAILNKFGDQAFRQDALKRIIANDTVSHIRRATFYGYFLYMSIVGTVDLTFRTRLDGSAGQLEISTFDNLKVVKAADSHELFNATLDNLQSNQKVLSNHSKEMQDVFKDLFQGISTSKTMDLSSYVTTCLVMAISQTRPVGMIKGYEQANVITPVISIKLSLLIPLLLVTVVLFIPYAIVMVKLHINDSNWLLYKFNVDVREYLINLCCSRFIVTKPMSDKEVSKMIREDQGDNGPVFGDEQGKLYM
ncbi:hypothetical protein BG015_001653 [Linnemannia schmuckeri]|uniref:Uncharacterized protein n=1 Tax=Linnemannia schmuckeri TaxID=64567 RepID=A0A9P5V6C4_9FUNG|nr:hypothetical protein BG015_001653 [Linnemannia schmuckeri]